MMNREIHEKHGKKSKGLVPRLRFPEFRDAGEWGVKKLIDVADKKTKWSFIGGPFGSNLKSSDYVADGIRIIQLQNIGDAEFFNDYKIFTSEEKADELLANNIYPGEIILSKMGDPVGRACLIPYKHARYVMCSDGIRLVVDEKAYSKYFIYTLINSIQFRALVEKTATGSTRKRIGLDDLKKLPIVVPKPEEQQKIADCLSSLDELITAEAQKIDTLKAHKKGLMQQLFPAEGETVPRLRFPEFRGAGEWEESSFGGMATFFNGRAYKQEELLESGKYRVLRVGNFFSSNVWYYSNLELEDNKYCEDGDLLYAWSASFGPRIWRGEKVIYHYHIWKVLNNDGVDKQFLLILLNYETERMKAQSANGLGILHITKGTIESWKCYKPIIEEQQKIADCLSSLDELITAEAQKIDTLKAHKKGLMQGLFPSADEVGV